MERGLGRFVAPLYCRPAARWGIGACDCITHRDGEAVLGLTLSEAVEKMRGRTGTDITLTVRREGRDPFDVTVTRDVVRIQSVRSRVEGNAGYVRITTFRSEEHTSELQSLMRISYAVFCLKKTNTKNKPYHQHHIKI